MSEKVPITVALGIGLDGKPHASRFADSDAPLVERAAQLMGFHAIQVPPDNEELHGVAESLPRGRIFSTGRAFVPFVSRVAFDKLATLVEGGVKTEARAIGLSRSTRRPRCSRPKPPAPPMRCGPRSKSAPWCLPPSRISTGPGGGKGLSSASMAMISLCGGWMIQRRKPSTCRAAMSGCATPPPIERGAWLSRY